MIFKNAWPVVLLAVIAAIAIAYEIGRAECDRNYTRTPFIAGEVPK